LLNIVENNFTEAEQILEKEFSVCIKNKMDIYATRGALTFAKLYLSKGDYKKALDYIRIGNNINEKNYYQPFEVQLRVLENMAFLLKRDFVFAKKLAKKNIKYLSSQKEKELLKDYLQLWQLINKVCDIAIKKLEIPNDLIKEAERLNKSLISLYANLPLFVIKSVLKQN
jgi:tetratricopeptide (TPR) repeat protein